jgi:hypothetical protein
LFNRFPESAVSRGLSELRVADVTVIALDTLSQLSDTRDTKLGLKIQADICPVTPARPTGIPRTAQTAFRPGLFVARLLAVQPLQQTASHLSAQSMCMSKSTLFLISLSLKKTKR